MCVRLSDYVNFNFRNIPTFGENPLSCIVSFSFFNCSRRDAVGHWAEWHEACGSLRVVSVRRIYGFVVITSERQRDYVHLMFEPQNSSQIVMVISEVHMNLIFFSLYYEPHLSNLTKFSAQSFTHSSIQEKNTHTWIHKNTIHAYIHICIQTYIHAYKNIHTHIYIHMYIYIHTYIHIYTYIHTYAYIHKHIHIHIYAYIHTHIYIHTHTCARARTHTYNPWLASFLFHAI
jgi:hypothetical protein